jgi:bacteriorhodopsin
MMLFEEAMTGLLSTNYLAYSPETHPHLTHFGYLWRHYDTVWGLMPVLIGVIVRARHRRAPHPVYPWIVHAAFLAGVLLLVASALTRHNGTRLLYVPIMLLVLVVMLYLSIND